MSVTFRIQGIETEDGYEFPCPRCRKSMRDVAELRSTRGTDPVGDDCPECFGYGGPERMPPNPFELNVANAGATRLLPLLGVEPNDELMGSIDPEAALRELALAEHRIPDLVVGMTELDGVASPEGYIRDRVAKLRRICEKAQRYGREVTYA